MTSIPDEVGFLRIVVVRFRWVKGTFRALICQLASMCGSSGLHVLLSVALLYRWCATKWVFQGQCDSQAVIWRRL